MTPLSPPCLVATATPGELSFDHGERLQTALTLLNIFLVGDDLARNGLFADAASTFDQAMPLVGLSPEMHCAVHLRQARYLTRAGHFSQAREHQAVVARLQAALPPPMREHVQAEWAVQDARLRYDDVAHTDAFAAPDLSDKTKNPVGTIVDAQLSSRLLNIQASAWRRQMAQGDLISRRNAFQNSLRDSEASIYWALVCGDAFLAMNLIANLGYLLYRAEQDCGLDYAVAALQWLMMSQRYIHRYEWQDESLWDYIYLAELYLNSPVVRAQVHAHQPFVMHALTPDSEAFYRHALRVGERLGEVRQLATMYQMYCQFLEATQQSRKAWAQWRKRESLLAPHGDLRAALEHEANPSANPLGMASPSAPWRSVKRVSGWVSDQPTARAAK